MWNPHRDSVVVTSLTIYLNLFSTCLSFLSFLLVENSLHIKSILRYRFFTSRFVVYVALFCYFYFVRAPDLGPN